MRVGNPKLVVEPGAGRTGKLAMVEYQFQQFAALGMGWRFPLSGQNKELLNSFFSDRLMSYGHLLEIQEVRSKYRGVFKLLILESGNF
jgi:hypothetical protein